MAEIKLFGVRHHGPGSARSLLNALEAMQPDIVLLEGPPDAENVLHFLGDADMVPPVALLVYAPEEPRLAAYYPLTVFSPEYQALRFAIANELPMRFMDLPQSISMPLFMRPMLEAAQAKMEEQQTAEEADPVEPQDPSAEDGEKPEQTEEQKQQQVRLDPLGELAKAAGYADGERWWDHMIEQRRDHTDIFSAVLEAMSALREELGNVFNNEREDLREAHMRQTIRQAEKDGYERIAVICGAWHTPALRDMPPEADDVALLSDREQIQVDATWIPWTNTRLTFGSGYGAGIESPGWYQFLWENEDEIAVGWLTQVAHLLRTEDLPASPAQVIDAVRLSDTLATLRGRPVPDLHDMNEAALSVLCYGNDAPMKLIAQRLIVGDAIGEVPDGTPMVPLQRDLHREQRRLNLRPQAYESHLRLDLREDKHLQQSYLLHRLGVLGVKWGEKIDVSNFAGTFREMWKLNWFPELTIRLIEQSAWGNTVKEAATGYAIDAAENAQNLPALTTLVNDVLLADLPDAVGKVVARLQDRAALTGDIKELMLALPPLADVLAYSDVRQTHMDMVRDVIDGIVVRSCVGLPGACHNIETDVAKSMREAIVRFHSALYLIDRDDYFDRWYRVLLQIVEQRQAHGLLRGRACRLLVDDREMTMDEAVRRISRMLSLAEDPEHSAAWLDGFLSGSGLILLHDDHLLPIIDRWVKNLSGEQFEALVPLLRRTFMSFHEPEVRQIARRIMTIGKPKEEEKPLSAAPLIDGERANAVLATLSELLGPTSDDEEKDDDDRNT